MAAYLRLLRYIRPFTGFLFVSLICSIVVSSVSVMIIPTIGNLSKALGSGDRSQLNLYIIIAISLYLAKSVFSFGQKILVAHADQGITKKMRTEIFSHLQDLSLDFYSRAKTGDIITVIMHNISQMQEVIMTSFVSIIPGILTVIGVSVYLFNLNWKLSILSLIVLPFVSLISSRFVRNIRDAAGKELERTSNITSVVHEVITGIKIVKSFTMEKEELKKFDSAAEKMREISLRVNSLRAMQAPLYNFIQAIAAGAIIWVGGFEILSGSMTPSNLIAFFTGVLMLGDPLGDLSGINITVQTGLMAAKRYFEILDTVPSVRNALKAVKIDRLKGEIKFNKVTFRYGASNTFALKNVSLNVRSGEVIAIVGHSGAGKSTLASLIPRFYDATKGQILIDGREIKKYDIISLRKNIGMVPQEVLLFSGSIKDNISYGCMDATQDNVENAAKMANAHDFIMVLPQKYDTIIGERGMRLSGGERQRISIARAFLRDPKILILDEATSALDSHSEKQVQNALENLMKDRTTIVIAHRLSTVRFANRIIVLKGGELVEQGTHKELMKHGGEYKKMHDMQMGGFAETTSVFGMIELEQQKINYGGLNRLKGWVISDGNLKLVRVRIRYGDNIIGRSTVNRTMPEVRSKYPNYKHSLKCGFAIDFIADPVPNKIYSFQVIAEGGELLMKKDFRLEEFTLKDTLAIG